MKTEYEGDELNNDYTAGDNFSSSRIIKDKDLRLGNLVIIDSKLVEMKVEYFGKVINPLLIDDKILLDFGFVKIKDFDVYTNIYQHKSFMISLGDYSYINIHVDWVDVGEYGFESIRCYEELFAHELQNIYFSLTGEELTFESEFKFYFFET